MSAFRELRHGIWLFVWAVTGMVTAGFICAIALLTLDRHEPIIRELAWAFGTMSSVIGAIVGGAAWMTYKRRYLTPKT